MDKKMKISQALDLFLGRFDNKETKRAYKAILAPMCDYVGTARPCYLVKPQDVHLYYNEKAETIAPATRNKHVKAIKHFFSFLVDLDIITKSPAAMLHQKRLSQAIEKEKAVSEKEVELIKKVVFGHRRNMAIINFLADTGCRAGGVAGLRIETLDLDGNSAKVTEKGNKTRPVWFSAETTQMLRVWLVERPPMPDNPYVFPGDYDGHLKPETISTIIRRACAKAGIRSLGAHAFRHRKGHQLADARVAPSVASTALGHSDVDTTLRFYYPKDYGRAEAAIRETHEEQKQPMNITLLRAK